MPRRAHRLILSAWLAVLPALGWADEPVDLDWFEGFIAGQTLHFERDGVYAGAETFLKNRQTVWQNPDGSCMRGAWLPQDGMMCFVYEGRDDIQCWHMLRRDGDLFARPDGDVSSERDIRLIRRTPVPLSCNGPNLGV